SLPLAPFRGDLPWPVRGRVRAAFGDRSAARRAAFARRGIEIAAPLGSPVTAVHDGRVAFAGPFAGFGTLVIVEHEPGAYSLYGHLETAAVGRGDHVDRRAPIGTVGLTPGGRPALYFELRVDGRPVDPLEWLER
ncbi:MAG TPA: peptidoglycan DD-metalloendopeptidase family protein, partial [Vicinamibacterales bacterium]|nr:peptidoglycan DD-metalloendopeptidase family protein [Vicinamibacterales bacterium]